SWIHQPPVPAIGEVALDRFCPAVTTKAPRSSRIQAGKAEIAPSALLRLPPHCLESSVMRRRLSFALLLLACWAPEVSAAPPDMTQLAQAQPAPAPSAAPALPAPAAPPAAPAAQPAVE